MSPISTVVPTVAVMLAIIIAVALASRFFRVPYTVGLVLAGLGVGVFYRAAPVALTPDVVLLVFLPPLLFAGAWTMSLAELRRSWLPIGLFAIVGTVVGIAVTTAAVSLGAGLPWRVAIVFGSIVAATDPVAVTAILRSIRIPERLGTIIEGESLFNDGVADVAFRIAVAVGAASLSGSAAAPASVAWQFLYMMIGGFVVGVVVGFATSAVLSIVDDYFVEATGTLTAAYGAYLIADWIGTSGIIAVLFAGLVLSKVGQRMGSFTETREAVNRLWEFIAYLANSALFLLIGLQLNLQNIFATAHAAAWGIAAVLLGRFVIVYGFGSLLKLVGARMSTSWMHVLALAGMRGALSMALVLSLPQEFPERELLTSMVFSVVLFTLVVQGLLLRPGISRMDLRANLPLFAPK